MIFIRDLSDLFDEYEAKLKVVDGRVEISFKEGGHKELVVYNSVLLDGDTIYSVIEEEE